MIIATLILIVGSLIAIFILTPSVSVGNNNNRIPIHNPIRGSRRETVTVSGGNGNLVELALRNANYPRPTGQQRYGVDRRDHRHAGVDIAVPTGTKIYAPFSGTIVRAKSYTDVPDNGSGTYLVLKHRDSNYHFISMHHSENLVGPGDEVSQGMEIAKVGGSGFGVMDHYAAHAHFEIREGDRGQTLDPMTVNIRNESAESETEATQDRTTSGQVNYDAPTQTPTFSGDKKEYIIDVMLYSRVLPTVEDCCGLIGNLMAESGQNLSETALNNIGASGIAQWLGNRKEEYKNQFGRYPHERHQGAFECQVVFMAWELVSGYNGYYYRTVTSKINSLTSQGEQRVIEASDIFMRNYEVCGGYETNGPIRRNFALSVYRELVSRYGTVGSSEQNSRSTNETQTSVNETHSSIEVNQSTTIRPQ